MLCGVIGLVAGCSGPGGTQQPPVSQAAGGVASAEPQPPISGRLTRALGWECRGIPRYEFDLEPRAPLPENRPWTRCVAPAGTAGRPVAPEGPVHSGYSTCIGGLQIQVVAPSACSHGCFDEACCVEGAAIAVNVVLRNCGDRSYWLDVGENLPWFRISVVGVQNGIDIRTFGHYETPMEHYLATMCLLEPGDERTIAVQLFSDLSLTRRWCGPPQRQIPVTGWYAITAEVRRNPRYRGLVIDDHPPGSARELLEALSEWNPYLRERASSTFRSFVVDSASLETIGGTTVVWPLVGSEPQDFEVLRSPTIEVYLVFPEAPLVCCPPAGPEPAEPPDPSEKERDGQPQAGQKVIAVPSTPPGRRTMSTTFWTG
jgi:hypothetical protein